MTDDVEKRFLCCGVIFSDDGFVYHYRLRDSAVHKGDFVFAPVAGNKEPSVVKVVSVGEFEEDNLLYPLKKMSFVERKLTAEERAAFEERVPSAPEWKPRGERNTADHPIPSDPAPEKNNIPLNRFYGVRPEGEETVVWVRQTGGRHKCGKEIVLCRRGSDQTRIGRIVSVKEYSDRSLPGPVDESSYISETVSPQRVRYEAWLLEEEKKRGKEAEQARQKEELLAESEKRRIERDQAQAELKQARVELKQARAETEKAQTEAEKAQAEAERVRAELQQVRVELKKARTDAEQSRAAAKNAREKAEKEIGKAANSREDTASGAKIVSPDETARQENRGQTTTEVGPGERWYGVRYPGEGSVVWYRADGTALQAGDHVLILADDESKARIAEIVSAGDYASAVRPSAKVRTPALFRALSGEEADRFLRQNRQTAAPLPKGISAALSGNVGAKRVKTAGNKNRKRLSFSARLFIVLILLAVLYFTARQCGVTPRWNELHTTAPATTSAPTTRKSDGSSGGYSGGYSGGSGYKRETTTAYYYGGSGGSGKKHSSGERDPYYADEFADAEDFYEEYYDDFDGFEDAEDYWENHVY